MRRTVEFIEDDFAAVNSAAKIVTSRYRDYVDYQDVAQEMWAWMVKNYRKVVKWREEYSPKHAERTVVRALRNVGERYSRKEKAEYEGYSTEDEFFYSIPMCADLLQLYFDDDWMIPNGLELTRTSGGKPPSEGGNLMAMVADVGRAYEALPPTDRELLKEIYGGEMVVSDAIALRSLKWDITQQAASDRIRRVVGRLRQKLGGPSPYGERNE